jgi:hypothetical protein
VRTFLSLCVASIALASPASAQIDWQRVYDALGRKATVSGEAHRYGLPRFDLSVTLDGVSIKPSLALGGWIAFQTISHGAMLMGDLVLLESEVNPVISKLLEGGIEVTAVHNHLLRANPATFYVHVGGHGDPVKMASVIREALGQSATPTPSPPASAQSAPVDLDTAALDKQIGVRGQANGGVYQFAVPRQEIIYENGALVTPPGPMGVATGINFQPTGGDKAAITGDFVLTQTEVNPVMKMLRSGGIEITAIHSHMLDDEPRLFFLHFWANDDAMKLARSLRAALDKTASRRTQ